MREPGYYWVRLHTDPYWLVGEFTEFDVWLLGGEVLDYSDSNFAEIDERRIVRNEP